MLCKSPRIFPAVSRDAAFSCGSCDPCNINKRRVWAHRLILESTLHDSSVFLTCTYDDRHLPGEFYHPKTGQVYAPNSVYPEHHRLFLNNLRTTFKRKTGRSLRFYGVGEYGEKTHRPHYHYALFGYPACSLGARWHGRVFKPCVCPSCDFISKIWGKGHIFSGSLTSDSANYIAGYVTKKLTSDKAEFQKEKLAGRHPEFSRMSTCPGIAGDCVDLIASHLTTYGNWTQDNIPRSLVHGSKVLPLGRYLSDKLYAKMGIEFLPGERLEKFERTLRSMLLHDPDTSIEIKKIYQRGAVAKAVELLNSQRVLNLESQRQRFAKEKRL